MADNYIPITTANNRLAAALRDTIDQIKRHHDKLAALKADMDQMTDGATYTTLATAFGLESTADAQSVYNLVTGAVSEFNADTQTQQLISWTAAIP